MPLPPGATLGPYTVTAKIGEGGMGEVYQARDTKLDRDVALKVLPDAFTSDPDPPTLTAAATLMGVIRQRRTSAQQHAAGACRATTSSV